MQSHIATCERAFKLDRNVCMQSSLSSLRSTSLHPADFMYNWSKSKLTESVVCPGHGMLMEMHYFRGFPIFVQNLIGDSKSCLSTLNWPRSKVFGTFWVGGGDIRYWLEMASFGS